MFFYVIIFLCKLCLGSGEKKCEKLKKENRERGMTGKVTEFASGRCAASGWSGGEIALGEFLSNDGRGKRSFFLQSKQSVREMRRLETRGCGEGGWFFNEDINFCVSYVCDDYFLSLEVGTSGEVGRRGGGRWPRVGARISFKICCLFFVAILCDFLTNFARFWKRVIFFL